MSTNLAVAARTFLSVMKATDAGQRDEEVLLIGLHAGLGIASRDPKLAAALMEQIENMTGEAALHDELAEGVDRMVTQARGLMGGVSD